MGKSRDKDKNRDRERKKKKNRDRDGYEDDYGEEDGDINGEVDGGDGETNISNEQLPYTKSDNCPINCFDVTKLKPLRHHLIQYQNLASSANENTTLKSSEKNNIKYNE